MNNSLTVLIHTGSRKELKRKYIPNPMIQGSNLEESHYTNNSKKLGNNIEGK